MQCQHGMGARRPTEFARQQRRCAAIGPMNGCQLVILSHHTSNDLQITAMNCSQHIFGGDPTAG